MPSLTVYLNDELRMPNGQALSVEDLALEVEYGYHAGVEDAFTPPAFWHWDYWITDVAETIAVDEHGNDVRVLLSPDHPAIRDLTARNASEIEDACRIDAMEAA